MKEHENLREVEKILDRTDEILEVKRFFHVVSLRVMCTHLIRHLL